METYPQDFPDFDRNAYPQGIFDVTHEQRGSASRLIVGSEKSALYDCGNAYGAEQAIANIRQALDGRKLDYVLVSHTHFDHIGALPYILDAFPEVEVLGSAYAQYVFTRPGALKVIRNLSVDAAQRNGMADPESIPSEGWRVDRAIADGDEIDLGDRKIVCLETKGHTDCCMSFVLEPDSILLASESTGQLIAPGVFNTAILKSFEDVMASADKCQAYGARQIMGPHYGLTPEWYANQYFDDFRKAALHEKEYMTAMWNEGLTPNEMLERGRKDIWPREEAANQTWEGFVANFTAMIKVYEQYATRS